MSAIFISHSSRDSAIANEVKAQLEEQGHRSVFLDFDPEDGIPAGRNWEKELYARLRACQAMIVLCSEHSMASQWCFAEIAQARSLGKHLFPLKVAAGGISPLLSDVQVTDLALNPSEGYQRLWSGLKKVGLDPADLFDWDGRRPPYPGLLAFQEQDAAVYFGREGAIQGAMETLNRLQRLGGSRLVLVLGASGSGKSSLMRAGVIPRLKRDKDRWLVLEPFRPLGRPFDELAMAFSGAFAPLGLARDWKSIRDALNPATGHAGGAHLLDLASDLRVAAGRREATVVLTVDQFEELLGRDTDQSANLFLRMLKAVLTQPNSPFLAVATLRSDFLGAFQTLGALQDLPYEPFPLPQMTLGDFGQVIEGPARVAGVALEAGLAQAMVADTATDDALPLLAFTLRELWDRYSDDGRLTMEEYRDRLGGLQGSLARAAEAIFAERALSAEEESHLRKAFLSMVRVGEEGRYVRRPALWNELPEDAHPLLERFVQARLLVSRGEAGKRILEVAHEALFRSWDRLIAWLHADREFLLWRQRLRGDIAEWERNQHDESMLLRGPVLVEAERWLGERSPDLNGDETGFIRAGTAARERERANRERLRRKITRTLAAGLVFALILAGFAGIQWRTANEQASRALSRELAASAVSQLPFDPELSLLLAIEGYGRMPTAEAEDALRLSLLRSRVRARFKTLNWFNVAYSPDGKWFILLTSRAEVIEPGTWRTVAELTGPTPDSAVRSASISGDGKRVLTIGTDSFKDKKCTLRIWESGSWRQLAELQAGEGDLPQAILSPDGQFAVTWGVNESPRVWNLAAQEWVALGSDKGTASGVAFSPNGKIVATVNPGTERDIRLWESATGKLLYQPDCPLMLTSYNVAFGPDGGRLAMNCADGTTQVIEVGTWKTLAVLGEKGLWPTGTPAFSPDGKWLVILEDRTAQVWETATWRQAAVLRGHTGDVDDVKFSGDGNTLVTASHDGTARVWEVGTWRGLATLRGHTQPLYDLAVSPDGRYVVTTAKDSSARVWEMGPSDVVEIEGASDNRVPEALPVVYSPDGRYIAVRGANSVDIWAADTARKVAGLDTRRFLGFSPDGKFAFTAGRAVQMWEVGTWRKAAELQGHSERIMDIAFSPDSKFVATVGDALDVWEIGPARSAAVLKEHGWRAVFSPDGKWVGTARSDQRAHMWEVGTWRDAADLRGHTAWVRAIAFSPDGSRVVTAGEDGTARIWETGTWSGLAVLAGHSAAIFDVRFSPDGKRVLTASHDGTARLWDAGNGKAVAVLRGHTGNVNSARFSPDGRLIATAGDTTVRVWEAGSGRAAAVLHVLSQALDSTNTEVVVRGASFSPDGKSLLAAGGNGTTHIYPWEMFAPMNDLLVLAGMRATRGLRSGETEKYLHQTAAAKEPGSQGEE